MAQELLEKRLCKTEYTQSKLMPRCWKYTWRPISFTLVVDDFGIKYIGNKHVQHLIQVLKQDYQIEEDWGGTQYIGLTVEWNYKRHEVHISMPGYVEKALARFGHQVPKHPQHQLHKHTILTNEATVQYAKAEDKSRLLAKDEKKYIQLVIGTFCMMGKQGPNNAHKSQRHSVNASQTHQRNNDKNS